MRPCPAPPAALALMMGLTGCASFDSSAVASWRRIQDAYRQAESDGVSTREAEKIVALCLADAAKREAGERFGRYLFAVKVTRVVADLETGRALRRRILPQ